MRIQIAYSEQLKNAIEKCVSLFDCYHEPPIFDGIQINREYLEKKVYYDEKAFVLEDDIYGGVYGDIAGQMLHILEKSKLITPETMILYNGLNTAYARFRSATPQRCADMVIHETNDDPDSDCFRGRRHLLDMFWEGCIEQNYEWNQDD